MAPPRRALRRSPPARRRSRRRPGSRACGRRSALGRRPDAVARAAREIDADDLIAPPARRVARRIRGAEHRDDRRADRLREVHRPGVAGHEQIELLQHGRDGEEIGLARQIENAIGGQRVAHACDLGAFRRRAGEDDRRPPFAHQPRGDVAKTFFRPLLDRAPAADVDAHLDRDPVESCEQPHRFVPTRRGNPSRGSRASNDPACAEAVVGNLFRPGVPRERAESSARALSAV